MWIKVKDLLTFGDGEETMQICSCFPVGPICPFMYTAEQGITVHMDIPTSAVKTQISTQDGEFTDVTHHHTCGSGIGTLT